MKILAVILLLILFSGCIGKPQQPSQPQGSLGMGETPGTGLTEMPSGNKTDESLVGEPLDLGSII